MKNLSTAIFGKMTSATDLYADVQGRLYKGRAPEGAQYPYIVYLIVSNYPEKTFTEDFEVTTIQFSLFSAASGSTEVEDMYTHLKALYDECNLSVTGSTWFYWMKRTNAILMVEDHTVPSTIATIAASIQVWHYAVDYEIKTLGV